MQLQPKEESVPPSLSTTIAALKDALSEGTTEVEEGEIHEEPHLPLPEDLAVRGWTHLRDNIVNHITRWIHDNPEFYPALALQFEDQDTIFREVWQALEGLYIICQRIKRDAVERLVQVEAEQVRDTWEDYIKNAQWRVDILQIYDRIVRNRH